MYFDGPDVASSGIVLSPYLLISCLLDNPEHRGARGGDGSGEDEADGVSHDFEDDDPPRVVRFHARLLRLLGVSQDGFDLLFG